jgi:hypothetical protein
MPDMFGVRLTDYGEQPMPTSLCWIKFPANRENNREFLFYG